MGFERWWLPAAPKVKKPRSTYNAASLAYLGDCIYEVSLLPSIYLLSLGYVEIGLVFKTFIYFYARRKLK
jgi:hypothetical protein